jgi:DNA invertase Pin-like site-specific DNA recombinase
MKHEVEVADIYTEFGSTNKFSQMINKLFNSEADGILCMSLARLSRNSSDFQKIALAIDTKGIQIITPSQVFNSDPEKKFLMNLGVAIDTFSKALICQRIKAGIKNRKEVTT